MLCLLGWGFVGRGVRGVQQGQWMGTHFVHTCSTTARVVGRQWRWEGSVALMDRGMLSGLSAAATACDYMTCQGRTALAICLMD